MGYAFRFEQPAPGGTFSFNNWQMGFVREIMREAGAAAGQGLEPALRTPGLEPTEQTADMEKFLSNGNWHVSAEEAGFIATRLRLAASKGVVAEVLSSSTMCPTTSGSGSATSRTSTSGRSLRTVTG